MIDSVWSWLHSIGMARYASQLYAGARNWSATSAATLINGLIAPEEHKQVLHFHLSRLRQFVNPVIVAAKQKAAGVAVTGYFDINDDDDDDDSSYKAMIEGEDGKAEKKARKIPTGRRRHYWYRGMDDEDREYANKEARDKAAKIKCQLGDLSRHPIFGPEKVAEDRLRALFMSDSKHADLAAPWSHCIDIYSTHKDAESRKLVELPKIPSETPLGVITTRQSYYRSTAESGPAWVELVCHCLLQLIFQLFFIPACYPLPNSPNSTSIGRR
jgi:hypothetical protein